MGENEYKISLGVELDTSDIVSEINRAESKIDPIKIKVDAETKELTKSIQDALRSLSNGTKNTLTLDTSKFESSIADIKSAVIDLKKVLGSLDDSANMKSLLVSVNQIANAIGNVKDESETLVKSLSVLSKKNFGFNFNLKTGNTNPVKAMTDYGREARRNTIPQLQEQAAYLQNLLGGYQQADKALERYLTKIHKASGISIKNSLVDDMSNTDSIAKQMEAIEKYIGYLKQIATTKGIKLDGFDAQFSKSAENIVDDTVKIQTGAKQAEEALEAVEKEMKQIFGGGVSAEGLSESLKPIIDDLSAIRKAFETLSSIGTIDGLTTSFKELAEVLEQLTANITVVKQNLDGISNVGSSVGQGGSGVGNLESDLKQVTATIGNAEDVVEGMNEALSHLGVGFTGADAITKDIQEMGIEISKVATKINGNNLEMSVTGVQKTADGLERVVTVTKKYKDAVSNTENINKTFTQSFETSADVLKRTQNENAATIREIKQEMTEFVRMQKQIGDLEIKIGTLEAQGGDADYIADLKRQLAELNDTYDRSMNTFRQKLFDNAEILPFDDIVKFNDEIEAIAQNVKNKLREVDIKIANEADAKVIKEINDEISEFIRLQKQIENTKFEIGKLEITGDSTNQIEELQRELKELEDTYEQLMHSFMQKISANADIVPFNDVVNKLDDGIDEATRNAGIKLEQFKAKWADTRAELSKSIKADIEFGKYDNQLSQMYDNFNKLSGASVELRESVSGVESAYRRMEEALQGTGDEVADRERLIQAEKDYADALEKTNNLIRIQSRIDKNDSDRLKLDDDIKIFQTNIDSWLTKNSAATKQFGSRMLDLKAKAEGVDRVTLNGLIRQFKLADKEAEKLGVKGLSSIDKLKSKFNEYATYLSAAEVFSWVSQGLRDMFEQVKLIDSAMTELKKVTNETDAAYDNFLSNAASKAKEIGTTIDGYVSSTADFARLGYSMSDAADLAEVANIYAVVGDDIDSVETATESLISTMTAFGVEASNSMSIVDKFNIVGNNFAISSGGIGEALERSASSMAAANNSLDETIALITAAM